MSPELLDESGRGPLTAAEVLITWSHPGSLRSETAFAMLAGVAPIPASSGQVVRSRLNRHEDRALNCTLYTIVLNRCTYHEETRQYVACLVTRGRAIGKSDATWPDAYSKYSKAMKWRLDRHRSILPISTG